MALINKLTAIADAIRAKTGKEDTLTLDTMVTEIANIETGVDTSDATAAASDILNGKTAYVNGQKITGTISSQAAKTITPSSSIQTAVAAGKYTTGAVKVAAIPSSYTQLNFTVVGGTSAPSSPSANTIWVNTSTSITSWVFSTTQPEAPAAGMVWISTGAASTAPFNALKKNNVTIYPISAKQYVSGSWVDKTAKSYQGGAWVEWQNGHLYEYGNQHEGITGGWTSSNYKAYNYNTTSQFNADNIYIWGTNGGPVGGVGTVNKIDLSRYTKLKLLYTGTNTGGYANLSVLTNQSDDIMNAPSATATIPNGTEQTVTLDITNIDEGYIAIGTSRQVYIYDVWLE